MKSLWDDIETMIEAREAELQLPGLLFWGRRFFLQEIDERWIDHLKSMEALRECIGLRGYGQKDPKLEYKKEGFEMFMETMNRIKTEVIEKVMRVEIHSPEQLEAFIPDEQPEMHMHHGESAEDGDEEAKQATIRREQPKVGRNDPCPCGSGKKYKKCCLLKGIHYDAPRPVAPA